MTWAAIATAQTDFNSLREDGTYRVLRRRIVGLIPTAGDNALLEDGEGHSCLGHVLEVSDAWVSVSPVWDTWSVEPETDPIVTCYTIQYGLVHQPA